MFQFRRFPAYTYLIQCTLTEYCSAGFPHSEISGSTLICSSPKLFAACRVLHRLLMPRHSPCALSSLTFVRGSALHFAAEPSLRDCSPAPFRFLPLPLQTKVAFAWFCLAAERRRFPSTVCFISCFSELCRLHRSSFFEIVFYP